MKYFQKMLMQPLKETLLHHAIIKVMLILILSSSCKAVKTTEDNHAAYDIINSFLTYYIEKNNRGIFLSPLVIDKENHAIIDVFNEEGKITEEVCGNEIIDLHISKNDFDRYIKTDNLKRWDYKKVKSENVTKHLLLDKAARIKYKKAKERKMLERENEWITYKYILWHNKDNVPLISLSYPLFSNDGNHAILYMSKYNGGGYVFVLKKETPKKWHVICEKNLFHY